MNAAQFRVQQLLRRYAQDCLAAAARIQHAERLQDVVRLARVTAPSLVASLTHLVSEERRLHASAERRIEHICKDHLAELKAIAETGAAERFGQELGRHQQEWQVLRGQYARQLHMVEREADRLLHDVERPSPPLQRTGG